LARDGSRDGQGKTIMPPAEDHGIVDQWIIVYTLFSLSASAETKRKLIRRRITEKKDEVKEKNSKDSDLEYVVYRRNMDVEESGHSTTGIV